MIWPRVPAGSGAAKPTLVPLSRRVRLVPAPPGKSKRGSVRWWLARCCPPGPRCTMAKGSVPPLVPRGTHRRSRVARGSRLSWHPRQPSLARGAPLALQPLQGGRREPGASEAAQGGDRDPQTCSPRLPPSAKLYSPLRQGQRGLAAPGCRGDPGGREKGVSWGGPWVTAPSPVLVGHPTTGTLPGCHGGRSDLQSAPGVPGGPGVPWVRGHPEEGSVVRRGGGPLPLRAPAPSHSLAHLCSWPARAPRGAGFATVTLKAERDIVGSVETRAQGPGP